MDSTCYLCVLWFQTGLFPDIKRGGGEVGVAVYDPYYGKGSCFGNAKVCFI